MEWNILRFSLLGGFTSDMNNHVKKYLKDCKKVFPFFSKKETIFFTRLKTGVLQKQDDKPNITYNELIDSFGNPKEILISYLDSCDEGYLISKMKIKNLIRIFFILIFSLFLIISLLELFTILKFSNQSIISEETIIDHI